MDQFRRTLEVEIPHLARYARRLLGRTDDAEELVQAVLERALIRADQWNPRFHLRPWLFRIQHNLYISRMRRLRREERWRRQYVINPVLCVDYEATVELSMVQRALSRLPPGQRDAILLIAVDGLSYQEVSDTLVVPVGTIRSRVSRGRETLRAMIGGLPGA